VSPPKRPEFNNVSSPIVTVLRRLILNRLCAAALCALVAPALADTAPEGDASPAAVTQEPAAGDAGSAGSTGAAQGSGEPAAGAPAEAGAGTAAGAAAAPGTEDAAGPAGGMAESAAPGASNAAADGSPTPDAQTMEPGAKDAAANEPGAGEPAAGERGAGEPGASEPEPARDALPALSSPPGNTDTPDSAPGGTAADEAIRAAAEALRTHNAAKLSAAAAQARGHILEPYVEYWELQLGMEDATAGRIHAFLERQKDTVLAERLRGDWIRELGRREAWTAIAAEHPAAADDDIDIACLVARAGVRGAEEAGSRAARRAWDLSGPLPDSCLPLVEKLIAAHAVSTSDVWARGRRLLRANDLEAARQTYSWLPVREQPVFHSLALASVGPQRYLTRPRLHIASRADRETVIFALERLARDDPGEAGGLFDKRTQAKFSPADQGYVFARIALHAARWHRPEALAWFDLAGDTALSDEEAAWRVRAALRAERWREVKRSIEAMAAPLRRDPDWVYWYGRALQALGEVDAAHAQFASIADQFNFYGRLASEELGQPLEIPPRGYSPSPEEVDEVSRNPALQRAVALIRLDLRSDALREWSWGTRQFDDHHLLAAAELARRAEIWDRAINAAERTHQVHDFGLRYMTPYYATFNQQSRRLGLDDSWVLGLARQESRFIANIRSSAGAIGLMQLMPATARLVARHLGLKAFKPNDVLDVGTNVLLGTSYLREMLDRLDGQLLLASAAYNAGPLRAERWRGERPLEGAIYAETIPFSETRDYVKKVLFNAACYAAVLGREPLQLKTLLSVVPPRAPTIAQIVR